MCAFKTKISNSIAVTYYLLNELKVRVDRNTLSVNLKAHPGYPNLLAISDCLTELKVDNQIYQKNKNDYNPADLIFPFIAHFYADQGRFGLVHGIDNGQVKISDERNKNLFITEDDFLKTWDGISLYAKPNQQSGQQNYLMNRMKSVLQKSALAVFSIALLVLLSLIFNMNTFQWPRLLIGLIKLAGLAVSILLIIQGIYKNHPLLNNLCGTTAGESNCNIILDAEAAKITPWLNWSDAGLFYYVSTFLSLLIFPVFVPILSWINLIALPYTIYSLLYQYKKRNWCLLCCTIQVFLIAEFFVFQLGYSSLHFVSIPTQTLLISFILCFLIPVIIWGWLKKILMENSAFKQEHRTLKAIKYDQDLFIRSLTNQPQYEINEELMPVILGNINSQRVVTLIISPFCKPCGDAYYAIKELLEQSDDLRVKIIFFNSKKNDDSRSKIIQHFIALNLSGDENMVLSALDDWFDQKHKEYDTWAKKYPVIIPCNVKRAFYKQEKWSEEVKISYTPTILVNGYRLSPLYTIKDLKYLIN